MVKEVKPYVGGEIQEAAIQDIMHTMMVINPSVEVYLLDKAGKILTYVSPYKEIEIEQVNLAPIKKFIAAKKKPFIKGDDPRFSGMQKVFSAAPIMESDALQGYLYIILASQESASVASELIHCIIPKLGIQLFSLALISALIIGLLAIWFLTKNLRLYSEAVTRFKDGDLEARVCQNAKGDFPILADTFLSLIHI